jgi:predicted O-methyltransferase YrrM
LDGRPPALAKTRAAPPLHKEKPMKRYGLAVLAACVTVLAAGSLLVYSAEDRKVSDEFRQQFLKDFQKNPLNTTAGDAMLLRILIESRGAKRGVEVGSAFGFGACNMGLAFERTGGRLDTIDIDPDMVKHCRENVRKMGLEKTVTCIEGDALRVLPGLQGEVDFVFLDAKKSDYLKYFKAISPRLKPGALVVADNVIRSADAMKDFLQHMQTSPEWETAIIRASMEKDDGMSVSYKVK